MKKLIWLVLAILCLMSETPAAATENVEDVVEADEHANRMAATDEAVAEKDLSIAYELPFNGESSLRPGLLPMDVHIDNSGESFAGNLQLLAYNQFNNQESLFFEQSIELEEQESATFPVYIPVEGDEQQLIIRVHRAGKEAVEAVLTLPSVHYGPAMTILAETDNAYHFMRGLGGRWAEVEMGRVLPPEQLPEEHRQIMTDILVIGDVSRNAFTDQQVAVLSRYVQTGGILVLSGGENFLPMADELEPLLPLDIGEETISRDFAVLTETPQEAPREGVAVESEEVAQDVVAQDVPQTKMNMLTGTPKAGAELFPHEEYPLFAGHRVGSGFVVLALFDVTAEPLASWAHNTQLWGDMLDHYQVFPLLEKVISTREQHTWTESREMPGMNPPSIPFAAFIWALYILIAGPVLYLVLKRMDKREWAWGLIPLLTLVTAVSIYFVGMHRIGHDTSSHTVSQVRIHDENLAEVNSAASFFVLEGDEYAVEVRENFWAYPHQDRPTGRNKEYMQVEGDANVLRYEQVPYMSLSQAGARGYASNIGYIEHELYVEEDTLKGTLINRTSFHLTEMELQVGPERYEAGDLAQGQSTEINIPLEHIFFNEPEHDRGTTEYPPFPEGLTVGPNEVHRVFPAGFNTYPGIELQAQSEDNLGLFSIKNKEEQHFVSNTINQELQITAGPDGKLVYPYGYLPLESGVVQGDVYEEMWSYMLGKGSVEFSLRTSAPGFEPEQIEVPVDETAFAFVDIEIWNMNAEEWETVSKEHALILEEEDLSQYMQDGQIRLKMSNDQEEHRQLVYPFFKARGEMK